MNQRLKFIKQRLQKKFYNLKISIKNIFFSKNFSFVNAKIEIYIIRINIFHKFSKN